ncbi:unnamed protein product [marine sediment metagenome]|uniref:Terminase small subunit n=1 Tax=marine sediment metagenome TaxID=412755 RepID=X1FQT5_9ZZZZ
MKTLTKKQNEYVELRGKGLGSIDAVMRAYGCSNRNSAGVISHRLLKNEKVMEELRKNQELLRQKTINKEAKFIDILKEFAPPIEVARRLAELIFADDKRTADSGIEKWIKLSALYPDVRVGLYRDLEKEREQVLTEADIKKLEEQKRLEERLPVIIEEAEAIEGAKEKKISKDNKERDKGLKIVK